MGQVMTDDQPSYHFFSFQTHMHVNLGIALYELICTTETQFYEHDYDMVVSWHWTGNKRPPTRKSGRNSCLIHKLS